MQNTSGITPVEFNVLVKQDAIEEKTKGGLHLPTEIQDRNKHGQTRGVIVAVSELAFNEDVWPAGVERPQAGQKIAFAKHSGTFVEGIDGNEYRIIKDKDVVGLIEA